MNKSRALCLGITSGLVVACGILMGILIFMVGKTVTDGYNDALDEHKYEVLKQLSGPYWSGALMYIVPGLMCFIAAFVQNKCYYITCCIVTLICTAIMGLVIFFLGMPMAVIIMGFYKMAENCSTVDSGFCMCRDKNSEVNYTINAAFDVYGKRGLTITPFKNCGYLDDIINIFAAVSIVIVIAWVFLLATFIVTIVYACKSKTTSGTVFVPAQQPMLTH